EVARQIIRSIGKIPDPQLRAADIKETCTLLEGDAEAIDTGLSKLLCIQKKDHFSKPVHGGPEGLLEDLLPQAKKEGLSSAKLLALSEKETLRLLINYGFEKLAEDLHVCDYLLQEVQDLEFSTPVYQ